MAFNTSQIGYVDFREVIKQRVVPVVGWFGAGASKEADLPSWSGLRDQLLAAADAKASSLGRESSAKLLERAAAAKAQDNLWLSFKILKEALQETTYETTIRHALRGATGSVVPHIYKDLWKLGINGAVTLNIDEFASRAFSDVFPGAGLHEFDGVRIAQHADALSRGIRFVANLHGELQDSKSWIFTQDEFEKLKNIPAYSIFINSIFTARRILFVGISADDIAVGGHLERLRAMGVNFGSHYWLTSRNDTATVNWAESVGVNLILYNNDSGDHREIREFISDLAAYVPHDVAPGPVVPSTARERNFVLIPPDALERERAEVIRELLNKEAAKILSSKDSDKNAHYERFWAEYEECIYRAWSVSVKDGRNDLLGYKLVRSLKSGGFGEVYEALSPDNRRVAIKILHGNIKAERHLVDGFRRGVEAMRILARRKIDGMVPYLAAWEIPACAVMDFIDGPNLQEAVADGYLSDWNGRIKCSLDTARILRSAHFVPEKVLHRDVRPANIMLVGNWGDPDNWNIVVLDFDLSWHRDATGVSVVLSNSLNGYLAPEQLRPEGAGLARNALVDSFGLGMTMFFIVSGKHPVVEQHNHGDWKDVLLRDIASVRCEVWRSLPMRFARLVERCTMDRQADRWDMTRIIGELEQCSLALKSPKLVTSCEMVAEEIFYRTKLIGRNYKWDWEAFAGVFEIRSGFSVRIYGDETNRKIVVSIDWMNTGDRNYGNISKYIAAAKDASCARLKEGGWRVFEQRFASGECRIRADKELLQIDGGPAISDLGTALSNSVEELMLN